MSEPAEGFLALHVRGEPLLMPNPWDAGSARQLATLGYRALATTSSGFAGTLGRLDGGVTREEALAHGDAIAGAVEVPVSADLEHGFGDAPEAVAETLRLVARTRLAGCSVEDWRGELYEPKRAAERVRAAAEVARDPRRRIVLTARAEGYLRGQPELGPTLERLQAYQEAGADVLYAPGMTKLDEIDSLVRSLDAPVNVLLMPRGPSVAELAGAGVARISVGGWFHLVSLAAVESAALALLEHGTTPFFDDAAAGRTVRERAFE